MSAPTTTRPRIEGERESEILEAVVSVLLDVGYDKLTFDAVASAAKASKATLYRRWSTKAELVVDSVMRVCDDRELPDVDTGTLRGDLVGMDCDTGGLREILPGLLGALMPAIHRDAELSREITERIVEPLQERQLAVYERARARGEITTDVDLERISKLVPALVMHDALLLGRAIEVSEVEQIIDTIVLPLLGIAPPTPGAH